MHQTTAWNEREEEEEGMDVSACMVITYGCGYGHAHGYGYGHAHGMWTTLQHRHGLMDTHISTTRPRPGSLACFRDPRN